MPRALQGAPPLGDPSRLGGRFAYCHRSVVVNLRHVRTLSQSRLVLDDGTELPVSRRRYPELREAIAAMR